MAIVAKEGGLYQHERTGFILHPLEKSRPDSGGAIFFHSSRTDDYIVVGGKTLQELIRVFAPSSMHGMLALAKQLRVTQLSREEHANIPRTDVASPQDVEYDRVFSIRTDVVDLVGFSDLPEEGSGSSASDFKDALWLEIGFSHNITIADAIDTFYSGMPKQSESKVVDTINKAKRQVVEYLSERRIDVRRNVPFYLKLVFNPSTQNWCLDHDSIVDVGGLQSHYVITDGERSLIKTARRGLPRRRYKSGIVKVEERHDIAGGLSEGKTKYQSTLAWEVKPDRYLYHVLPVTSIMATPLHALIGGLAGAHALYSGEYSPAITSELSLKLIDDYISYKASSVLDGDVLVRGEEETVSDFELRQEASRKVIEARQTNVRATACAYSGLSMVFLMELCDRAIQGGAFASGNPNRVFGEPYVGDPSVDVDDTPQPLAKIFKKSY